VGYLVTIITVMIISNRFKCMAYSKRNLTIFGVIPVYFGIQRIFLVDKINLQFLFMVVTCIMILFLYRYDIKNIFRKRVKQ